jgi:hypothetical protein
LDLVNEYHCVQTQLSVAWLLQSVLLSKGA